MARAPSLPPRAHSRAWPDEACTDLDAEVVRLIARRVAEVRGELSLRALARQAEIDHATLSQLLGGSKWPSVRTVARLERVLKVQLWPNEGE